jgi:CHORD
MKVLMSYDDNENEALFKTLKITLPKSWKTGPTSKLLAQFIDSYNESLGMKQNVLNMDDMHLAIRRDEKLVDLCSDAIVIDTIPDRAEVYVMHGASKTLAATETEETELKAKLDHERATNVACTHFGCKQRFPPGGPYPPCTYHKMPPVFHETVKFWSCCPAKKAYDWNDFEAIPGCCEGTCTEIKEEGKQFLGGTDLRKELNGGPKLKSIDDFNSAQAAGGASAAPILERLQSVMEDLGTSKELFDQVVAGIRAELEGQVAGEPEMLAAIAERIGGKLKAAMKAIVVDQLRIK